MSKTKTYTIEVTQEDIDNGVAWECGKCPVALAAKRVLPFKPHVRSLAIYRKRRQQPSWRYGWYYIKVFAVDLPQEARDFISDFDHGVFVTPFSFQVEVEL
jgi:hypothetical protein